MRGEQRGRYKVKKLDFIRGGVGRHRVPAMDWRSKLDFTPDIYHYDRGAGNRTSYITYKELAHSFTIITASGGAIGLGIGQFLSIIFRG